MVREELNNYLQHAPEDQLTALCRLVEQDATVEHLGTPTAQTMMVPVHDPITGGSFLAGEVLVTSCIVKVNGTPGWAMVLDDLPQRASRVALLDAAYGAGLICAEIAALAELGKTELLRQSRQSNRRTNGTRVRFDLLSSAPLHDKVV